MLVPWRFGLEVCKALSLIDVWGADRVSIKLNPTGGYNNTGMPLQETLETFSYFISEADKFGLAYINLVRREMWNETQWYSLGRASRLCREAAVRKTIGRSAWFYRALWTWRR
ncbi:uncharacterized protein BT62DRAFT_1070227 [Guyanagaster necrorhizus]|uniref:Uncharacterized protein n=1 Tax=Guyanagaster necrorhizus TaxID=856835 RepID=A0A9P7W4E3_9AGAR|nr:uncharacterized protein BT62DRAFT_1070227 [Guyanagaster necrorhizus MCA 3950]KAG7452458.1 hypothetical protein BT62DRAFT_1070227 [Guyanagaster necrorhizus MCA 3950]